ncbi:hypothetical protein V8E54_007425 [Elaphomyces granulatus]
MAAAVVGCAKGIENSVASSNVLASESTGEVSQAKLHGVIYHNHRSDLVPRNIDSPLESSGEFIGNDWRAKHSVEERPREVGVFSECEVKLRTRNQPSNMGIDKISATLFVTLVDDSILIVHQKPRWIPKSRRSRRR